ncbi:MAG TPA: LamG domain-containing protein [Kofleriaceae bacterium]
MRATLVAVSLVSLVACSVPDKQAAAPDSGGGSDAGTDTTVDTTVPETTIDEAPDPFSRVKQPTFRFSSTDAHATFECRLDSAAAAPCTSPYVVTLADGPHNFSVRALDPSGMSDDTPAETVWTIDTVAPNTTLTEKPPSADNSTMAKFSFTATEMNVTFDCSLDGGAFATCSSGASFGPVSDGAHSFQVRARDRAGNVDLSPAVYAWNIDTSTPDTTITDGPTGATTSTTATFKFVSPDAGGGSSFACALDGAALTACTSPMTYNGLSEASHTFAVRVRDAVGNVDPSPATATWIVDLTAPITMITAAPTGVQPTASASITFTANETAVTFACALDGGAYAACTSPAALTGLGQGAHTYAVRATDAAGNADASPPTASWSVDTVPPDVTITSGPAEGATVGPRVVFGVSTSEGTTTCNFDGAAPAACSASAATNLAAGPHSFTVHAADAANNTDMTTRSFTVACAPPAATGALGQLHLDDGGQQQPNAVTGGAAALLGATAAVEATDPTAIAAARFAGGLMFAPDQHVTWPLAGGTTQAFTIELWARPNAPSGSRDLVVTDDGRIALRVTTVTVTTVRFAVVVGEGGTGTTRSATSAAVASGAWHHVLASLAGGDLRLWVDGAKVDNALVVLGADLSLDALTLGGAGATAYDGALDEVWISAADVGGDEAALGRYCPAP